VDGVAATTPVRDAIRTIRSHSVGIRLIQVAITRSLTTTLRTSVRPGRRRLGESSRKCSLEK